MASAKAKFDAAVQAIRSLPKNGPFQPSYAMMKQFYGLYKQATEGPCREPKPGFWNAIARAKWEAWTGLGDMPSEEAQDTYVNELLKVLIRNAKAKDIDHMIKIVETMPQTEQVQEFLQVMGPFFELVRAPEDKKPLNGHVPHLTNGGDGIPATEENLDLVNGNDRTLANNHMTNGTLGEHEKEETEVVRTVELISSDLPKSFKSHKDSLLVGLPNGSISLGRPQVTQESDEEKMLAKFEHGSGDAETSHPFASQLEEEQPTDKASVVSSGSDEFCDTFEEPEIIPSYDQPAVIEAKQEGYSEQTPLLSERRVRFEDLRLEQPITSTPISTRDVVVTQAQVHQMSSAPSMTEGDGMEEPQEENITDPLRDQRLRPPRSTHTASQSLAMPRSRRPGVGLPGSHAEPTEHIVQILERLQRDMNSVLVRLNTLENLALTRHQAETQESLDREVQEPRSRFWPFGQNKFTLFFLIFVWPFIISGFLRFLRRRRPRP